MSRIIEARLIELGVELPVPAAPAANYLPYVVSGNLIFISGQISVLNNEIKYVGKVGVDLSVEDGISAARLCMLNVIAQARAALDGELDRITRFIKVGGFVNSTENFTDHPKIINGASDFLIEIFGEIGRHSRFAVGVNSLPLGIGVEIDAILEFSQ